MTSWHESADSHSHPSFRSTTATRARAPRDSLGPAWALGGIATSVVLLIQLLPFVADGVDHRWSAQPVGAATWVLALLLLIGLTGAAVAFARTRPGVALALAWGSVIAWSTAEAPLLSAQGALGVIAFTCARWGTSGERFAALASLPLVPLVIGGGYGVPGTYLVEGVVGRLFAGVVPLGAFAPGMWAVASLVSLAALTVLVALPFAAGLMARTLDERGRRAESTDDRAADTVRP